MNQRYCRGNELQGDDERMNTGKSHNCKNAKKSSSGEVVVCHCFQVTDTVIEHAVREQNLATVQDVAEATKAGSGCATCRVDIEKIITAVRSQGAVSTVLVTDKKEKKPAVELAGYDRDELIKKVVEGKIRPLLLADDGDITLIEIADNTVRVSVRGSDPDDLRAEPTLLHSIEHILQEQVDPKITIEEVES